MMKIDVKTNAMDVIASLNRFASEIESKAIVRALNKTAMQARTEASRVVRDEGYKIKASAIKASFSIERANPGNLVVALRSTGKPIALINFSARQTKTGVSVSVKTGRNILKHAFIRSMKNGHTGVFQRVGAARVIGAKRSVNGKQVRANLPIEELFGPSIPSSLANEAVQAALMKKIREKFPKILEHELKFIRMKK